MITEKKIYINDDYGLQAYFDTQVDDKGVPVFFNEEFEEEDYYEAGTEYIMEDIDCGDEYPVYIDGEWISADNVFGNMYYIEKVITKTRDEEMLDSL